MPNRIVNLSRVALVAAMVIGSSVASAQITNCTPISTVPSTISAPGIYCLAQDVSWNGYASTAITIAASNVTLDLNGYQIRGSHLGGAVAPNYDATAIGSSGNSNVIVRNGRITGTDHGITIAGGMHNLVENLQVDDIPVEAISLKSDYSIVRNNIVAHIDGNLTSIPTTVVLGIVLGGNGSQALNNTVTGLRMGASSPTGSAIGIYGYGAGNALIEGNFVQGGTPDNNDIGIVLATNFPANVMVVNNRLSALQTGVTYTLWGSVATGVYSGNMTSGVAVPYVGGTAKGLNF